MKDAKLKLNRRSFLVAAGVGGVGGISAAAALVAGNAVKPAVPALAAPGAQPKVKGYHVSEHIEKYYKTTQI